MDLETEKQKRDARIQAKKERIKAEGQTPAPETTEISEPVSTEDDTKAAREENVQDTKPEKKPE